MCAFEKGLVGILLVVLLMVMQQLFFIDCIIGSKYVGCVFHSGLTS